MNKVFERLTHFNGKGAHRHQRYIASDVVMDRYARIHIAALILVVQVDLSTRDSSKCALWL
jgi:hypothetical protein